MKKKKKMDQKIINLMIQFIVRKYQHSINLYYSKIKKKVEGKNPDFIILGTQKGGTTSLYNYIASKNKI